MTNIGMHFYFKYLLFDGESCASSKKKILKIVISGLTKFSEVQTYGREIVC